MQQFFAREKYRMFGTLLQPEAMFYSNCTKSVWRPRTAPEPARGAYCASSDLAESLKGPLRGQGERGGIIHLPRVPGSITAVRWCSSGAWCACLPGSNGGVITAISVLLVLLTLVACVGAFLYVRYYYVQRVGRTPRRTAAVRSTTQVEQA